MADAQWFEEQNIPAAFAEDVLALVCDRPRLLTDVIEGLRSGHLVMVLPSGELREVRLGRRWYPARRRDVVAVLREYGAFLAWRHHGAGAAEYAATAPFSTVVDGRGKVRQVQAD